MTLKLAVLKYRQEDARVYRYIKRGSGVEWGWSGECECR